MLVRFIKNWTLPLAMLASTGIFLFADIPFVEPAKPYVNGLVAFLTPLLIFPNFCSLSARWRCMNWNPNRGMDGYCCSRRFLAWLLRYCWCVALWRRSTGKCLKVQWSASFVPLQPLRLSLPVNWVEAHPAWRPIRCCPPSGSCGCSFGFPLVEPHADITFLLHSWKFWVKSFHCCFVLSCWHGFCVRLCRRCIIFCWVSMMQPSICGR